jgi:hypothetical protein
LTLAEALKILGQAAPAGATDAAVYTVGAGKSAVVSSLVACNTSGAARTIRVFARIAGAAAAVGNAIAYDVALEAGETLPLTLGIALAATDVLTCRSDLGGVTFTAFGSEIS